MKISIPQLAAFAVSAMLLPLGAQTMPLLELNKSVLIHIPAKDLPDFKSFIGQTLNEGIAGTAREWNSSERARKAPVKVVVTPGAAVQTQSAGKCRLLSARVSQRSSAESWNVWFCQQANGGWKISGLE